MIFDRDHPLWATMRTAIVGGVTALALWLYYDRVDFRDLATVAQVLIASGAMEWWNHKE